ncbi:MAG: trehalose-phosphatase [Actinobacteria bacterium]|nr:trehalose-phosphatase [Actinomycetota bacterium]
MKKLKYVFDYLDFIKEIIYRSNKTYLFLDYDGTLTEIVNDPGNAAPPSNLQHIFKEFKNENFIISIVSGRHLADLKKILAGLKTDMLNLAGSHGNEIIFAGRSFAEKPYPEMHVNKNNPLENIEAEIMRICGNTENIKIEKKPASFALHYRNLPLRQFGIIKKIIKFLEAQKQAQDFKYMQMKKVIEVMPSYFNKAATVKKIINHYEGYDKHNEKKWGGLIICIGDDTTDEDLFKENKTGINIKVTENPGSCLTLAEYYLKNPEDVLLFLKKILLYS